MNSLLLSLCLDVRTVRKQKGHSLTSALSVLHKRPDRLCKTRPQKGTALSAPQNDSTSSEANRLFCFTREERETSIRNRNRVRSGRSLSHFSFLLFADSSRARSANQREQQEEASKAAASCKRTLGPAQQRKLQLQLQHAANKKIAASKKVFVQIQKLEARDVFVSFRNSFFGQKRKRTRMKRKTFYSIFSIRTFTPKNSVSKKRVRKIKNF